MGVLVILSSTSEFRVSFEDFIGLGVELIQSVSSSLSNVQTDESELSTHEVDWRMASLG